LGGLKRRSDLGGICSNPPPREREMVMDEPLDFEEEDDPLFPAPRPTKRKKVIGLDDLLLDYFGTGKDLRKVKAAKTKHGPMGHDSDEEDKKGREDEICKIFEDCEEKVIV
jgi:hypothetical protein